MITVAWYQQASQVFADHCSIAMQYDIKNRKTFLKRCRYEQITADMLYVGAVVTVYSRQLRIVDYADEFTRKCLSNRQERYTVVPLKASCKFC